MVRRDARAPIPQALLSSIYVRSVTPLAFANAFTRKQAVELGFDVEVIKRGPRPRLMTARNHPGKNKLGRNSNPKINPSVLERRGKGGGDETVASLPPREKNFLKTSATLASSRRNNKLVGYLAATSRKLGKPLAIRYPVVIAGGQVVSDGMRCCRSSHRRAVAIRCDGPGKVCSTWAKRIVEKNKNLSIGRRGRARAGKLTRGSCSKSEGQTYHRINGQKESGSERMEKTQEYHGEGPP